MNNKLLRGGNDTPSQDRQLTAYYRHNFKCRNGIKYNIRNAVQSCSVFMIAMQFSCQKTVQYIRNAAVGIDDKERR